MDKLDDVMENLQHAYADLLYYIDQHEDELSEENYDIISAVSVNIMNAMDDLDPLTDVE